MNIKNYAWLLAAAAVATTTPVLSAQDIYDDIYGPTTKTVVKKKAQERPAKVVVIDNGSATIYDAVNAGTLRDIDEYNRRGLFADTQMAAIDSSAQADFEMTRRIERFYNPEVVTQSADPTLAQVYYAEPANVNIIVSAPDYWGWGAYSSPWSWAWGPSWGWGWGPSWNWGWGPSWNWAWSPSWSLGWNSAWGWNWGWNWGWGPSWGPGWGWTGPAWNPGPSWGGGRPHNPRHPGAMWSNNRPNYGGGQTVGGNYNGGQRPGAGGGVGRHPGVSPSNNGKQPANGTTVNRRPGVGNVGQQVQNSRPSTGSQNSRPTVNNGSRPGVGNSSGSSSTRQPSYTPSHSSGGSRGGFSGGGGGGSRGGGGGGGRGGRH